MVIDTSALVALILEEENYRWFVEKMVDSQRNAVSAVT